MSLNNQSPSPDTSYPELGRLVRRILEEHSPDGAVSSARQAGRISGVSAATINSMLRGIRPSAANLRKFADAFHVSSLPLMTAAGYVEETGPTSAQREPIVAIADPDEALILARYRHLAPEKRRMARRLLDALDDVDDEGEGDPPPAGTRAD